LGEDTWVEPPTIYLDVDGVVTTSGYQRRAGKDLLDPDQVAIVAALVREFSARVVVSSTWRVADCRPTLVEAGLPEDCFHPDWRTAIPLTSRHPGTGHMLPAELADRGGEIVDVGPLHAGRHVRPDAERGLGAPEAVQARGILSRMGLVTASDRLPSVVVRAA
jgi:hypothetical protein